MSQAVSWVASLPAGSNVRILVRRGEYSELNSGLYFTNSAGCTVTVFCEPGVVATTSQVGGSGGNGIGAGDGVVATFHLNGARFNGTATASANGIGVHSTANVTVFGGGAVFTGYDDGWSNHGSCFARVEDCTFQDSTKGAFTHVNSSTFFASRCNFIGRSGATLGIGANQDTTSGTFEDCAFVPAANQQQFDLRNATTLRRCIVGSFSVCVRRANQSQTSCLFEDCFLNLENQGHVRADTYRRCFGKISFAMRGATADVGLIENCVFVGPATGFTDFLQPYTGFVANSFDVGTATIRNSIFTGYTDWIDLTTNNGGGAAAAVAAINAQWTMQGVCLFNIGTIFRGSINSPSPQVLLDPLLADPTSVHQAGYLTASNSPCRGAGLAGANIGLPV